MGAQVFLTDLPDRMRLLKKNVETNLKQGDLRGSATVHELTWGDDPEPELIEPLPDYGNDLSFSLLSLVKTLLIHKIGFSTTSWCVFVNSWYADIIEDNLWILFFCD